MLEACAEPYKKEVEVFSSLTEDRNIQQVVTEECAERDVPSLPELSDILADKRITEVFVKVETEYTSKTYGYIGISGYLKFSEKEKPKSLPSPMAISEYPEKSK